MGTARRKKSIDWKIPAYMYLETSCKSYWKVNICEIGVVLIINFRTTEFDKTVLRQFELLLLTFQNIWYCLDRTDKMSCLKLSVKVCFLSIKSALPPPRNLKCFSVGYLFWCIWFYFEMRVFLYFVCLFSPSWGIHFESLCQEKEVLSLNE